MTTTVPRQLVIVALLLALLTGVALVNATPAAADRCQPEELATGPATSPMDEKDNPVCHVLIDMGFYGFVCGGNVPTGLMVCVGVYQQAATDFAATGDPGPLLATLDQQITPGHQPNLGAQYQPDDERVVCNAFLWTIAMLGQPGTCIR